MQIGDKVTVDGKTGTITKIKGQYATVEIWTQTIGMAKPKPIRVEYKMKFLEAAQ